jgi:ribonuclease H / adenosylcobalamin/alpha-ribazole phosphatase
MTRLYIVRHAETYANRCGRYQGSRADPPLTSAGRQAATQASLTIPDHWFTQPIICSTMRRAIETATLLAAGRATITAHHTLREFDAGDWTDQLIEVIDERWPGMRASWNAANLPNLPGGERAVGFGRRVWTALEQCAEIASPADVVVVTHAGVIREAYRLVTAGQLFTPASLGAIILRESHGHWELVWRTGEGGGSE